VFPVLGLGAWLADRRHERALAGRAQAGAQADVSTAATASKAPGTRA
jgi:hypothetical protein